VATARKSKSRLDELTAASDRLNADPWAVSRSLRARFRVEKKEALERQAAHDGVREQFALHDGVHLDDEEGGAGAEWTAARLGRGLEVEVEGKKGDVASLGETIRTNTKRKYDAFGDTSLPRRVRLPRKVSPPPRPVEPAEEAAPKPAAPPPMTALGGLVGYGSDGDSE
jgi:coiled-coil domain-containing protein 130